MPRGQRREAPPDVIGAAVMVGRIATGEIEEGTEPETKAAAATAADSVSMRRPTEIDIVRKAYELWERSGKPEGRDQEFYLQALQELQAALTDQAPDQPE